MFALRRKAVQSADQVGRVSTRISRRWASAEHGKTSDAHGHHHAGPTSESFGVGFPTFFEYNLRLMIL